MPITTEYSAAARPQQDSTRREHLKVCEKDCASLR